MKMNKINNYSMLVLAAFLVIAIIANTINLVISNITLIIEATSILKIDTLRPLSTTRNSTGYYLYYLRQYKSLKMKRALYYLR